MNPNRWAAQSLIANNYDVVASILYLERLAENKNRSRELSDAIKGGATALRRGWVKPGEARRKGSLLQVEIPDEDVMLDEQKTFEEQPEKVKKSLEKYGTKEAAHKRVVLGGNTYQEYDGTWYLMEDTAAKDGGYPVEEAGQNIIKEIEALPQNTFSSTRAKWQSFNGVPGERIYERVVKDQGSAEAASRYLNSLGIKGITYEGGRDGRCYVVFDDDSIEITARFSLNLLKDGKKHVDNSERKLDNRIENMDTSSRNDQITRSVVDKFNEEVAKLEREGWSEEQIAKLLKTENSFLHKEVVKPWAKMYNQFHGEDIDKKGILNRIFKDEHACDGATYHDIDRVFDVFKNRIERMMDDANMVFAECANTRGSRQAPVRFDSWRDVERSIAKHGGTAQFHFSLNLNSNTNEHSGSQGASSMPGMQETSRKWLDGVANTLAKKLHLKGDRIITEDREKGQYEDITLKQYLLNSPSRIADKVKSFRLFFRMGDRAMDKLTKLRSDYQRKLRYFRSAK